MIGNAPDEEYTDPHEQCAHEIHRLAAALATAEEDRDTQKRFLATEQKICRGFREQLASRDATIAALSGALKPFAEFLLPVGVDPNDMDAVAVMNSRGRLTVDPTPNFPGIEGLLTVKQRDLIRHALGLTRQCDSYRNHFVTGEGSNDYTEWMKMVEIGAARRRKGNAITGGDDVFYVTWAGANAAKNKNERLDTEDFPELRAKASAHPSRDS